MYIPLRVHSVYSKGRGSLTLKEMADWCRGQKLPAAALSDDKNLYGWAEWKRRAAETSVAPLFGCEIEIGEKVFLFLVKNTVGYHNLMDILNSGEWKTTEGLVTIFIPRPGEEDDLRKLPPSSSGDFYLGVDFFNYRHCREAAETFHVPLVWAHPLKFVSHPERLILLHAM
ncbi:MAG: PHP domain-containing protein, partial [Acidobacteria bacterium]|nr:PHP domain-containing protein [Acidobacteriota bacterium]